MEIAAYNLNGLNGCRQVLLRFLEEARTRSSIARSRARP